VILTREQAVEHVYGADARAVAAAVCFALGLASTRDPAADALASWALDLPDESAGLEAFSAVIDLLAWGAVTALKEAA